MNTIKVFSLVVLGAFSILCAELPVYAESKFAPAEVRGEQHSGQHRGQWSDTRGNTGNSHYPSQRAQQWTNKGTDSRSSEKPRQSRHLTHRPQGSSTSNQERRQQDQRGQSARSSGSGGARISQPEHADVNRRDHPQDRPQDHRQNHRQDQRRRDERRYDQQRRDRQRSESGTYKFKSRDYNKPAPPKSTPPRRSERRSERQGYPTIHYRSTPKYAHAGKPNYKLYKRRKYIYYHTPWYNSWFVAPIHWRYHRVGFKVVYLPTPNIRIVVRGATYFYYQGIYYRPHSGSYVVVAAPFGAVVSTLPVGVIAFTLGLSTYYYVNDTYYLWDGTRDGFVVVEKPRGADQAMEEATQGRLIVYPNKGQSEEQQAKDRYECHLWAVSESNVDPTLENQSFTQTEIEDYRRAMTACLEGRDYTVK